VLRANTLVFLAIALLGPGCNLTGPCENSQAIRVPSPDERLAAWVFVRSCGATTADSVQVSVLPASAAPPREAGNAFIIEHQSTVIAKWPAPRQLLISYEPLGEAFKKESQIGDVTVSYREE
jgi:hypothetical protein